MYETLFSQASRWLISPISVARRRERLLRQARPRSGGRCTLAQFERMEVEDCRLGMVVPRKLAFAKDRRAPARTKTNVSERAVQRCSTARAAYEEVLWEVA